MSTLRAIKKLVLGETWILPAGVAAVLVAGALLKPLGAWPHVGGALLLAGAVTVLVTSVMWSARR
jgi:hypothetical protein